MNEPASGKDPGNRLSMILWVLPLWCILWLLTASDGVEALELPLLQPSTWSCSIVMIAEADGYGVCQESCARKSDVPSWMLTALVRCGRPDHGPSNSVPRRLLVKAVPAPRNWRLRICRCVLRSASTKY